MEKRIVFSAILTVCVQLTCAFNEQAIQCCQCISMFPIGVTIDPQVNPSPFKIEIDPKETAYSARGPDINVNLRSDDPNRSFRSFMIQARRAGSPKTEAIGTFKALDDNIDAFAQCAGQPYGEDLRSAITDTKPKKLVRLAWIPPTSLQGHIEFRATFIEDEETFWVKEKSRLVLDPTQPPPPEMPLKYIPPPIKSIDVSDCGNLKGCYRIPEGCIEQECEYIFTWKESGKKMKFEMSAITDGFNDRYFAVALSEDIYMGSDMVFECVHNFSSGKVEVYQSFNTEEDNKNVRFIKPKMGITFEEGSYNAGRLRCRFDRTTSINDEEYADFPLTAKPYHILMARGPAWRGKILRHGMEVGHLPAASPDPVNLPGFDDITGRARYHLVKAHACLMLIAWIFFAPIGLLWVKYYTEMWPNRRFFGERYWFSVHYNCAFWVVLLVVISVILIFIEADGYSNIPELPGRAHPILGIIIFCCILLIPIIALLRCPEDHTCRPLGNWFYFLFWAIAFCLAIPNIFIGMDFGKANVPWWLTWILCIFFLFHLICEVILEIHQCCTHKKNKERKKKYMLQKKENPKAHIPEPWPVGRNFKRNILFIHFIVCIIVVLIAVITVAVA